MNQLDKDIKFLEFWLKIAKRDSSGFLNRLNKYLNELKMFRMKEILNVETELNSVESRMQLSKSISESYDRWQIARQFQDQSQITKQGEVSEVK